MTSAVKSPLHLRNLHRQGYPFTALIDAYPSLSAHVTNTPGGISIDFANPDSVKALNAALLSHYYHIHLWDLPQGYLCPPVPGRADYIHHIADLLAADSGDIPTGKQVRGLDIGVGANVIYPIIGSQSYGWQFVGSDCHQASLAFARLIVKANPALRPLLKIREQKDPEQIFAGIIAPDEQFTFSMCNPPFYGSEKQALEVNQLKTDKLKRHKDKRSGKGQQQATSGQDQRNFAGQANELYCDGGELAFIRRMIEQSADYANQVDWFTTLVSNKENLKPIYQYLQKCGVKEYKTVPMAQGQKQSRFVAWCF